MGQGFPDGNNGPEGLTARDGYPCSLLTRKVALLRLRRIHSTFRSPGHCPGPRAFRGTGRGLDTPPATLGKDRSPPVPAPFPAAFRGTAGAVLHAPCGFPQAPG